MQFAEAEVALSFAQLVEAEAVEKRSAVDLLRADLEVVEALHNNLTGAGCYFVGAS